MEASSLGGTDSKAKRVECSLVDFVLSSVLLLNADFAGSGWPRRCFVGCSDGMGAGSVNCMAFEQSVWLANLRHIPSGWWHHVEMLPSPAGEASNGTGCYACTQPHGTWYFGRL